MHGEATVRLPAEALWHNDLFAVRTGVLDALPNVLVQVGIYACVRGHDVVFSQHFKARAHLYNIGRGYGKSKVAVALRHTELCLGTVHVPYHARHVEVKGHQQHQLVLLVLVCRLAVVHAAGAAVLETVGRRG